MLKKVITKKEIQRKVAQLGRLIRFNYRLNPQDLVLIGNLKGAFIFLADLYRAINEPAVGVDFVQTRSYGNETKSADTVTLIKGANNLDMDLRGKHIIIVDDIIDTGRASDTIIKDITRHKVASIETCFLISKKERRETALEPNYVGFEVPKGYLVGNGLGDGDRYRCLTDIFALEEK